MQRERDFHFSLDRAAGLVLDATCSARAAIALPTPAPHRTLVTRAIADLERAQQRLFTARNDPWSWQQPQHQQLTLV